MGPIRTNRDFSFEAEPNAMAEAFERKVKAEDSWEPMDDWHIACNMILDMLGHGILNKDYVSPFAGPTHPEVRELGDYAKIVHEPMDSRIIKERLNSGQYAVYGELPAEVFHRDVTLSFDNAKLYYNEGHEINQDATILHDCFDKFWSDLKKFVNAKNRGSSARQSKLDLLVTLLSKGFCSLMSFSSRYK